MRKLKLRIRVIITWLIIIISLVELISIATLIVQQNVKLLNEQMKNYYRAKIEHISGSSGFLLENFQSVLKEAAKNGLIINSLVDELGREQYLGFAMSQIHFARTRQTNVGLYDFEFQPILKSKDYPSLELPEEKIIDQVIEKGESFHDFISTDQGAVYFIQATPVFYEGNPEGILTAVFNWNSIWEQLIKNREDVGLALFKDDNIIIRSEDFDILGKAEKVQIPGFQHLTLITKIPENRISKIIWGLQKEILLNILPPLVVILILIAFFVSKWLSTPITQLQKAVERVGNGQWKTVKIRNGSYETTELNKAINKMIQKLKKARQNEQKLVEMEDALGEQQLREALYHQAGEILHEVGNNALFLVGFVDEMFFLLEDLKKEVEKDSCRTDKIDDLLDRQNIELEKVMNKVNTIQEIVDRMSRRKRKSIDKKDTVIWELVEEIMQKRQFKIPTTAYHMIGSWDLKTVSLKVDPIHISQVIVNLVKNAEYAVREVEGAQITVNLYQDEEKFFISVKDNGCGITQENKDKVFEDGFTTKSSGQGIGLPLCRRLIEENNGVLFLADSLEGEGAEFKIELKIQ